MDRRLVERFSEQCRGEGLKVNEAIEEFMQTTAEARSIKEALNLIASMQPNAVLARELRAGMIIAELTRDLNSESFLSDWSSYGEPRFRELLALLPILGDPELVSRIKNLAAEINAALAKP